MGNDAVLTLLCLATFLVYLFRGIVVAAPVEFQSFLEQALYVPANETNVYFGLLESIFCASSSISIVWFGHFASRHRALPLFLLGLCLWCGGAGISGAALPWQNVYVLRLGRILSGVGDGALQALTPLFLEHHIKSSRQFWMSIYFTNSALGTGLSYLFGSMVTYKLGWHWAFYICAMSMTPITLVLWLCLRRAEPIPIPDSNVSETSSGVTFTALGRLLRCPAFVLSCLGGAAYLFTLKALATFGPSILLGVGTFPQLWTAAIFGLTMMAASCIGSPLGGYIYAFASSRCSTDSSRFSVACRHQVAHVVIGIGGFLLMTWKLESPVWFLVGHVVGWISLAGTLSPTTMAVLLAVPPQLQSVAMRSFTTLAYFLGEVPAPIVVGWVKDWRASVCWNTQSDLCLDRLRSVLLWTVLWTGWAVFFAFVVYGIAFCRRRRASKGHNVYVQDTSSNST
ncbi:Protein spinster 3 [Aphanomyces cochlioides]|nr:Protein spinster 3 [Aphanomyces cochlioides]